MQLKLLGLVAVVVIVWLYFRHRGKARKSQDTKANGSNRVEDTTYHAVSIKVGKNACTAAKATMGERYLASEAPRLPLPGCDAAVCECRFTHHKDRRSGKERRSPFGSGSFGGGTGRYDKERRERPDRRNRKDSDVS